MAWLWLGLFCLALLGFWLLGQANTSLVLRYSFSHRREVKLVMKECVLVKGLESLNQK
jgi:hypothetical protein